MVLPSRLYDENEPLMFGAHVCSETDDYVIKFKEIKKTKVDWTLTPWVEYELVVP